MKIKSIDINKMPGFPDGLEKLDDMAPNINIIAGPNGSGKSSIARALQKLIWWNKKVEYNLSADIYLNNEMHHILIDNLKYIHIDNKKTRLHSDFSYISSSAVAGRYMIALHDLIRNDDEDLARIIAKEINGGLDLSLVSKRMELKGSFSNVSNPAYKEYMATTHTLRKIRDEQIALAGEEKNINLLADEKKNIDELLLSKEFYEIVIEYLKSKKEYEVIKTELYDYPLEMEKFREDDYSNIINLEKEINDINTSIEKSIKIIDHIHIDNSGLKLPRNFSNQHLNELEERIDLLKEVYRDLNLLDKEISALDVTRKNVALNIYPAGNINNWKGITLSGLNKIESYISIGDEIITRKKRIENDLLRLDTDLAEIDIPKELPKAETLKTGIGILSKWLKNGEVPNKKPLIIHTSTLFIFIAIAIICFFLYLPANYVAIILGVFPLGASLYILNKRRINHQFPTLISDYLALGLQPPVSWKSVEVAEKLDGLYILQEAIIRQNSLIQQKRRLMILLKECNVELKDFRENYKEFVKSLLLDPDEVTSSLYNYHSFHIFLRNLLKWQEATIEYDIKLNEKNNYTGYYRDIILNCNELIHLLNFGKCSTHFDATAILKEIREEKEKWKMSMIEIEKHEVYIKQQVEIKQRYEMSMQAIYERLGLDTVNRNKLVFFDSLYVDYIAVRKKMLDAARNFELCKRRMENHSLYGNYIHGLSDMTIEKATAFVNQCDESEKKRDEIIKKITAIETIVSQTKQQNVFENALVLQDEALSKLQASMEKNLSSLTGDLIVRYLRKEVSLNNENRIVKEANRVLGEITNKRYSIFIGDEVQPVFMAYDNKLNYPLSLQEISTATRIQLLLSIRLAYIEMQEKEYHLPLMVDELLANSDDERSGIIIHSLAEISRKRQVFYFTAQEDEVKKWKNYLNKKDVGLSYQLYYLNS